MDANGSRSTRDAERAEAVRRIRRGVNLAMPVVLAGAMTVTMNLTGSLPAADAAPRKPEPKPRAFIRTTPPALSARTASTAASAAQVMPAQAAPARYIVARGDTISGIAGRFGLRTADILARNGLGWSSLIFPGQVLVLGGTTPVAAAPAPNSGGRYTIQRGDTISGIAGRLGVTTQSILDANGLARTSIIYPGQTLRIPAAGAASAGGSLDIQTVSSVTPTNGPSTPVVETPAPVVQNRYTVRTGDTISGLAARFGVTSAAIMQANGLTSTSIIFAGRTLVIPGVAALQDGSTVTPLTPEMAANARIVVQIGRQLGVPDRGIVIALAAAMQESSLRNVGYGDRDSVGLFQQRPSAGWGTVAQLTDVSYATRLFYGGAQNPNAGRTRGLLDIGGWSSMTVAQAAQKVQVSAYPDAYAKWEKSAWAWLAQLG